MTIFVKCFFPELLMTTRISLVALVFALGGLFALSAYSSEPYIEPVVTEDSTFTPDSWTELESSLYFTWADKDVHYRRADVPAVTLTADTVLTVWRGERVGLLALAFTRAGTSPLMPSLRGAWPECGASWVRYVITDEFDRCGTHPDSLPPYTVPDLIDLPGPLALGERTARPVWVTIEVPRDALTGPRRMSLDLIAPDGVSVASLDIIVEVTDRSLPLPSEQAFHLNLWQQPYSVSRYYGVPNWSDEHFELLAPYLRALVRAGQSTVSAILFYEPWGEQSNDKFEPMVETIHNLDGMWAYDYSVFDRWVEFCADNGLEGLIECFTMIPWEMKFRYRDAATGEYEFLTTTSGSPEYADLWGSFLKAFHDHVSEKGWADRTVISMDERALPDMLNAFSVAQEAVPGIKMALAGSFHPELVDKVYTYSLTAGDPFPDEALKNRRDKGLISTYYTSCSSPRPNLFSNNKPSDAAFLPLFCTASGTDGYLHWSFLNWTDHPLTDTRFRLFAPGDTYSYYPDGRPSVRFERLTEGIQLSEKLRILRNEAIQQHDTDALAAIEQLEEDLRLGLKDSVSTGDLVRRAHTLAARLSQSLKLR